MAFFSPNQAVADHPFTPRELVREEVWGEIWRAQYKDGRRVILVAYTTPEGDELFEEAEPHLQKWKTVAEGTVSPQFLKILEISQGAIPYTIIEDPGGATLREMVLASEERLSLEVQGKFGLSAAHALVHAESYSVAPAGITPDTIIENPRDRDVPFQVLPIAPGTKLQIEMLCGGRYFPKELKGSPFPAKMHPDSYSLAWIWSDVYRRDFDAPFVNPREAIPYKGLCFVLEMCLEMHKGAFSEPNTVMLGVDRWVRRQMKEDVEQEQEEQAAKKRGFLGNFFIKNRGVLKVVGIVLLVVLFLGGAGAGIFYSGMFDRKRSVLHPEDVADMYFESLITGDGARATELMAQQTKSQTADMIALITQMEKKNTIKPWVRYSHTMGGGGNRRVVETTLYDEDRKPFGTVLLRMQQRANLEWYIEAVFFKPEQSG